MAEFPNVKVALLQPKYQVGCGIQVMCCVICTISNLYVFSFWTAFYRSDFQVSGQSSSGMVEKFVVKRNWCMAYILLYRDGSYICQGGVHHICLKVPRLSDAVNTIQGNGGVVITQEVSSAWNTSIYFTSYFHYRVFKQPYDWIRDSKVVFVHPKSLGGILVAIEAKL